MVLRRYVFIRRSPLNDLSAEHDVAGITAKMVTTLVNSGTISHSSFLRNNSVASEAAFTRGKVSFTLPELSEKSMIGFY